MATGQSDGRDGRDDRTDRSGEPDRAFERRLAGWREEYTAERLASWSAERRRLERQCFRSRVARVERRLVRDGDDARIDRLREVKTDVLADFRAVARADPDGDDDPADGPFARVAARLPFGGR